MAASAAAAAAVEGISALVSKFSRTSLRYAGLWQKTKFQQGPFRVPKLKPSQFEALRAIALKEGVSAQDFDEVSRLPEVLPVNKYIPLLVTTRPHFFNGRWYSPAVGALQLARLRQQAQQEGLAPAEFPVQPAERVPMKMLTRPPKGHKRDVRKLEKAEKIKEMMAKMPQLIEEYRRERREAKLARQKSSPIDDVLKFKRSVEREERKEKRALKSAQQSKRKR